MMDVAKPKILLIAILGAIIAISLFNQTQISLSSLDFQLSLGLFKKAETEIMVPPLGTISAKTHLFPIKISLTLNNINFKALEELIVKGIEQQQLFNTIRSELINFLKIYVIKIICLGILGAMTAVFLLHSNNLKSCLVGSLVGLSFSVLLVGTVYFSYDYNKFYNPEYYGALENAPWMIDMLQDSLTKLEQLGEKIETVAQNVDTLYQQLDQTEFVNRNDDDLKILHVSDIHNNPLAFQLVEKIVNSFEVDIIVDTGDMTDFGTPLETLFIDKIESFRIPYLFVAGNHDSPQVINALCKLKNVVNVNGEVINVKGINFVGINDPASISNNVIPPIQVRMAEYVVQLNDVIYSSEVIPDILLVHNPWLAKQFAGRIPTILYGHNHQYTIDTDKGSVLVDAGTTGAAGIRGLATTQEVPYSLVLLSFQKQQSDSGDFSWQLMATDTIKLFNGKSGFTVEHQVYTD